MNRSRALAMIVATVVAAGCGAGPVDTAVQTEPGTQASGLLTGDERLDQPLELSDRAERGLPIDIGAEAVPFIAQVADDSICVGLRHPQHDDGYVHVCRPPAEWDSFVAIYSTVEEDRSYVVGAVTEGVDQVTISFGEDDVVIPTVAAHDIDQLRFFAAPVPSVRNTRVVGTSNGDPVLEITYPKITEEPFEE